MYVYTFVFIEKH